MTQNGSNSVEFKISNNLSEGTAATMRTNLGLAIGSQVQAYDADLDAIAALTATTDNFIVSVASAWASRTPSQVKTTLGLVIGTNVQAWDTDLDTWATITPTTVGTNLVTLGNPGAITFLRMNADNSVTARSAANFKTDLSLTIGTDVEAHNANLTGIAALTATTDNFIVSVASAWASRTPAQVKTTLGLVIGTDVEAHNANLTTIAGLTATTDNFLVSVSSAWASRTPAQVKTTLALNSVENTALSTWAGTANITTLGTVATGTWQGTVIGSTYGGTGINNAGRNLTINTNSGTLAFPASSTTHTFPSNSSTSVGTVATVTIAATASATSTATIFTPTVSGVYRLNIYMKISTTGTSPVAGPVTITYTEPTGSVAQSHTMLLQSVTGTVVTTTVNNSTTTGTVHGSMVFNAKAGVAIQYAIAVSGTFGAGRYIAELRLEAL